MKKLNLLALAICAMSLSSCVTTRTMTATEKDVANSMISIAFADLDVSEQKLSYTYVPSKDVRKAGERNCLNVAIREALKKKGNDADVLVETQEATITRYGLFSKKIKSITVTGYPAKYKNFRPASEETYNEAILQNTIKVKEDNKVFKFFNK